MSLIARTIMKPARSVPPDIRLDEAAQVMEVQRFSALPVVEADGRLIGILTKTDLLHEALANRSEFGSKSVGETMSPAVVTCGEATPVAEIASLMQRHRIHHLMVTDGGSRLVGVVSSLDLAERVIELSSMIENLGTA
jgi:CBS domain-containing protein